MSSARRDKFGTTSILDAIALAETWRRPIVLLLARHPPALRRLRRDVPDGRSIAATSACWAAPAASTRLPSIHPRSAAAHSANSAVRIPSLRIDYHLR